MNKITNKSPILEKKPKRNYVVLGALISAITIVHFVLQMSFIQSGNQDVIGSVGKIETPVEQIAETKSQQQMVELSSSKNEITQPDLVMPDKNSVVQKDIVSQKIAVSQKIIYPESRRPPAEVRRQSVTETVRKLVKKKIIRETESERLRRAEQILTGF